jgi:hypothetical protein
MLEAFYFHATLYHFASSTFDQAILRFEPAIQDVSAR